jgi:hypothetical protein
VCSGAKGESTPYAQDRILAKFEKIDLHIHPARVQQKLKLIGIDHWNLSQSYHPIAIEGAARRRCKQDRKDPHAAGRKDLPRQNVPCIP